MSETDIDFSSGAWVQIARWAEGQLASARMRNDAMEMTLEKTQALRGEIHFIKKLLGLPQSAARARSAGSAG